ncbi:MAG: class I SAM-dependent methyltransferase [Candidatus Acidiferrum sp.]
MKSHIQFVEVGASGAASSARPAGRIVHPFFAWAGFRPPIAQHTAAEHAALEKHARGKRSVVEIGVAEGASGVALRGAMDPAGTLYLVDPFHLSRVRPLNFLRRAARRAVDGGPGARTVWIEAFRHDAARDWKLPIDFLLIDGDHREEEVEKDWNDWHGQVVLGGIVAFHDGRLFPNGWTSAEYGPVRFIDRVFRQGTLIRWTIIDEVDSLVFVCRTEL